MYTIYYYRNDEVHTTEMSDLRGACVVAFNEVYWLGCDLAHVTDGETGEILRTYTRG